LVDVRWLDHLRVPDEEEDEDENENEDRKEQEERLTVLRSFTPTGVITERIFANIVFAPRLEVFDVGNVTWTAWAFAELLKLLAPVTSIRALRVTRWKEQERSPFEEEFLPPPPPPPSTLALLRTLADSVWKSVEVLEFEEDALPLVAAKLPIRRSMKPEVTVITVPGIFMSDLTSFSSLA
jgi:hypothetical protein